MKTNTYKAVFAFGVLFPVLGFAEEVAPEPISDETVDNFTWTSVYSPEIDEDSRKGKGATTFSAEAFLGFSRDPLLKDIPDLDHLEIVGATFRMTWGQRESDICLFPEVPAVPEFFMLLGVGGGTFRQTWATSGIFEELDYNLIDIHFAIGGNLRFVFSESVSLVGRMQIGCTWENVNIDYTIQNRAIERSISKSEWDMGVHYGVGVGMEFKIATGALLLGVDYVGSTASPDFSTIIGDFSCEEQAYIMFSVGCKWFF